MFRELPTFKGYTVDTRLKQFRKMILGQMPEFIEFDSPKGIFGIKQGGRNAINDEGTGKTISAT